MTSKSTFSYAKLFEGQIAHFICLALLLAACSWGMAREGAIDGSLFGLSTWFWFVLIIANTVLHQLIVWLVWRLELHGQLMTRLAGSTDHAFRAYSVVFAIMFSARYVLILLLGLSNRGTWDIDPTLGYVVAAIIAVPALYLFYSVKMYFGFKRAFGIDHFDADARNWPIVRKGIFRFTSNGMYVFGIGALWIPAFAFQSQAALVAAAFSHVYIWVHYFTVEKIDMNRIYGEPSDP